MIHVHVCVWGARWLQARSAEQYWEARSTLNETIRYVASWTVKVCNNPSPRTANYERQYGANYELRMASFGRRTSNFELQTTNYEAVHCDLTVQYYRIRVLCEVLCELRDVRIANYERGTMKYELQYELPGNDCAHRLLHHHDDTRTTTIPQTTTTELHSAPPPVRTTTPLGPWGHTVRNLNNLYFQR